MGTTYFGGAVVSGQRQKKGISAVVGLVICMYGELVDQAAVPSVKAA